MFAKPFYVQIRENQFQVRDIDNARTLQKNANPGFSHPRMLVGDFTAAQVCLKAALREAGGGGMLRSLSVIMHPLEKIEGGLTQVEERVLRELAIGAGAANVVVWVGAELSDADVIAKLKGK